MTLATVLVLFVLLVLACREVSHLNTLRHHALVAEKEGCVTDAGWAKVLAGYTKHTNMDSLHRWL